MSTMRRAAMYPPPPSPLQNIENKRTEKISPRKILYPKELDTKILHPNDLREENLISRAKSSTPFGTPARVVINQVDNIRTADWLLITGYRLLFFKELSRPAHWVRPPKTQQPRPRTSVIPCRAGWRQVRRSRLCVIKPTGRH